MKENDYKYILDSMTAIQIGSRFTYQELLGNIDLSYKYRCIIKQILFQEVAPETTLESHLYYMQPEDESCRVYQQLRSKIRIYVPVEKKHFGGKVSTEYEERVLTAPELASISPEQKKLMGLMIAEIQISRMGLMTFVV